MITLAPAEYLIFEELTNTGLKTRSWRVLSKSSLGSLGTIKFYSPWRQFVFAPSNGCLFNAGCMTDLTAACKAATKDWRENLTQRERSDGWG